MLLVDDKVAGQLLRLAGSRVDFLAFFQLRNDPIYLVILVGRLLAGATDDQGSTRFVDQDGVNFVDDAVVERPLHAFAEIKLHVVAQVIETKLVVGAVGDVSGVGFLPLLVIEIVHDNADRESKEAVKLTHPLGVTFCQVIVDGHNVHATPAEGVQVNWEGRNQGLAFTRLHFSDLALVQHHAADQLNIEVAHAKDTAAGFAYYGKRFYEDLFQDFFQGLIFFGLDLLAAVVVSLRIVLDRAQAFLNARPESIGLGAQLLVA